MNDRVRPTLLLVPFTFLACSGGSPTVSSSTPTPTPPAEACTGYPDWQTSPFVLPYWADEAYRVIQGNCSPPGDGHRGVSRYGYDFGTPIGSAIVAARGGFVLHVVESHRDGEVGSTGLDNFVLVGSLDGTTDLYGHLTFEGALVAAGDVVVQGQPIGLSGNTGNTGNIPHLHFSVQSCDVVALGTSACPTLPVTFRNTDPNPGGLENGRTYTAR